MIDCRQFRENLELIALQSPDVPLDDELQQHIAVCADCRRELIAFQEAWSLLPAAGQGAPISSEVESSLMRKIENPPAVQLSTVTSDYSARAIFWKYALAVSVIFVVAMGSFWILRSQPGTENGNLQQIKDLARQMERLEQLERTFSQPEWQLLKLRSVAQTHPALGYLVFDMVSKQGHFLGSELLPLSGHTYKVWLLGAEQQVISSATIEVNVHHYGAAIVPLPDDLATIHEVVVSLEAVATATEPSHDVRLRTVTGI